MQVIGDEFLETRGGRDKWVDVGELSPEAMRLTNFEPGEVIDIKGGRFNVELICLDPPHLILVPRA